MLRLRCGLRTHVEPAIDDEAMAENDANVDAETRNRNRRAREARLGRLQGEGEEQAMRRMTHESVLGRYNQLIPVVQFNKELDEFNTPECVICME